MPEESYPAFPFEEEKPNRVMASASGPFPRQVGRMMARAIADLGVASFEYIPGVLTAGSDYGKGCRVQRFEGPAPRWVVGVEMPDKYLGSDPGGAKARIWAEMDAFADRVLAVPGWRSYPGFTSCRKCNVQTRWFRTYMPNGGYGGSMQCWFIWDQDIERADLEKVAEPKPVLWKFEGTGSTTGALMNLVGDLIGVAQLGAKGITPYPNMGSELPTEGSLQSACVQIRHALPELVSRARALGVKC